MFCFYFYCVFGRFCQASSESHRIAIQYLSRVLAVRVFFKVLSSPAAHILFTFQTGTESHNITSRPWCKLLCIQLVCVIYLAEMTWLRWQSTWMAWHRSAGQGFTTIFHVRKTGRGWVEGASDWPAVPGDTGTLSHSRSRKDLATPKTLTRSPFFIIIVHFTILTHIYLFREAKLR